MIYQSSQPAIQPVINLDKTEEKREAEEIIDANHYTFGEKLRRTLSDLIANLYSISRGFAEYFKSTKVMTLFPFGAILLEILKLTIAAARTTTSLCLSAHCTRIGMQKIPFSADGNYSNEIKSLDTRCKAALYLYGNLAEKQGKEEAGVLKQYPALRAFVSRLLDPYINTEASKNKINSLLTAIDGDPAEAFPLLSKNAPQTQNPPEQKLENVFRMTEQALWNYSEEDRVKINNYQTACQWVLRIRRFCTQQAEACFSFDPGRRKILAAYLELMIGMYFDMAGDPPMLDACKCNVSAIENYIQGAYGKESVIFFNKHLFPQGDRQKAIKKIDGILSKFAISGALLNQKLDQPGLKQIANTLLYEVVEYSGAYNSLLGAINKETSPDIAELLGEFRLDQIKDDARLLQNIFGKNTWEYWLSSGLAWFIGMGSLISFSVLTFQGGVLIAPLILSFLQFIITHSALISIIGTSFLLSPAAPFIIAGAFAFFNVFVSYFFGLKQTRSVFAEIGRWLDEVKGDENFLEEKYTWKWLGILTIAFSASSLVIFGALKGFVFGVLGISSVALGWTLIAPFAIGVFLGTACLFYKYVQNFIDKVVHTITDLWQKNPENHVAFCFAIGFSFLFALALVLAGALADFVGMRNMFSGQIYGWVLASIAGGLSVIFNAVYNEKMFSDLTKLFLTKWQAVEKFVSDWFKKTEVLEKIGTIGLTAVFVGTIVASGIFMGIPFALQALLLGGLVATIGILLKNTWETISPVVDIGAEAIRNAIYYCFYNETPISHKQVNQNVDSSGKCWPVLLAANSVLVSSMALVLFYPIALPVAVSIVIALLATLALIKVFQGVTNIVCPKPILSFFNGKTNAESSESHSIKHPVPTLS